ncbi:MAG: DUF3810 domain-containing protein [Desulfobacterales bacterium]|nr:DUF3810 domain-containing protein [Desulfobacterales bacterium]
MYQEKRPTCVTVIGWAWTIIGGLTCLSAIMAFSTLTMISQLPQNPNIPFILRIFPLLAIVQIGFAILALVSGINFLKLKSWARNVLETLTWIFLVFIVCFSIFWLFNWFSMASGLEPRSFGIMGAVMCLIITGIYGVPFGIMLKYLRSPKVRNAMDVTAEPGL